MGVKANCGRERHRVLEHGQHTSPAPRLAHHDLRGQIGIEDMTWQIKPTGNMTWEIKSAAEK
jgi:hypothetical protein